MKKSLARKFLVLVILIAVLLFSFEVFAGGFKVEDSKDTYITKIVTAENVKGVNVRLSEEIILDDCNEHTIFLTDVLVSGNGDGYFDRYFFDAHTMQTKMFCPSDKPVRKTIYSKSVFIKSFTNENVKGKVIVSIVIPSGYNLEVLLVK